MIEAILGGLSSAAKYIIPTLLVGIPFYALAVKKVKVYEVFVVGAKDGHRLSARESSVGIDATLVRQRLIGLVDRPGQRIRRRLTDCKDWCNDVRLFRNNVLCTGRLLWICWRGSQPPCHTSRFDRRCRRCAQRRVLVQVTAAVMSRDRAHGALLHRVNTRYPRGDARQ